MPVISVTGITFVGSRNKILKYRELLALDKSYSTMTN